VSSKKCKATQNEIQFDRNMWYVFIAKWFVSLLLANWSRIRFPLLTILFAQTKDKMWLGSAPADVRSCQEHKLKVVCFLKSFKFSNIYFPDEINCWVPSRWKAYRAYSNNNFLITAPLHIKCFSFSKYPETPSTNITWTCKTKNTDKTLENRIDLRVRSHFPLFPSLSYTCISYGGKNR